jgi:hypothetical protein
MLTIAESGIDHGVIWGTAGASGQRVANAGPRVIVDDALAFGAGYATAPLTSDAALTLTYDSVLARVRISATGMAPYVSARIERSTDLIRWVTVRGGQAVTVKSGSVTLDDYEFSSDVPNYYRLITLAPSGQTTGPVSITPALDAVWLKSIALPFLNRRIVVTDWSAITRPTRTGVFDVIGRSVPIAVSDVRGSRRFSLTVMTTGLQDESNLDGVLAAGDVMFIHVPADCPVPGGYVAIGDTSDDRHAPTSTERFWELPCTVIAPPGPDIVGAPSTWQTVINTYATWRDVVAAKATWRDLLELIGSPSDVVVD